VIFDPEGELFDPFICIYVWKGEKHKKLNDIAILFTIKRIKKREMLSGPSLVSYMGV